MPIYEYRCADCERSVEVLVRPGYDKDPECPACHGAQLTRQMSVFAARGASSNGVVADTRVPEFSGGRSSGGGCCGGACGCH